MNLENIKHLRERTHLGITDCKNALIEAKDDIEKAIEILQKQGLKKIDDLIIPLEGVVKANNDGFVIELNCQTDFAARSIPFKNLLDEISAKVKNSFNNQTCLVDYNSFSEDIKNASKVLGEKIIIRRIDRCQIPSQGFIFSYNHLGGKVAVAVSFSTSNVEMQDLKEVQEFAENIAMQVAAMKPLVINSENLDPELVIKKRASFEEEAEKKPEPTRAKIVAGKFSKWHGEVALLDQESLVESKITIKKQLERFFGLQILSFVRYERGET